MRRKLIVLIVGFVALLVASEGARSKVLDVLFGAEEEFEFAGPPASPTPPGAAPGSPLSAV